ncbi:hypothetical protein PO124_28095 [Bacillus licheniformis]|nr:hypothetical protein [Bacillus licheniformis]
MKSTDDQSKPGFKPRDASCISSIVDDVEAELERIETEETEYGKNLSSLAAEDEEGGDEDESE